MIEKVLKAAVGAVEKLGYKACSEFSFESKELEGALVCVSAGECRCMDSGMGRYLGFREEADGSFTEIFGKRLEPELIFKVYAPFGEKGAGICRDVCSALCGLEKFFPSGLRLLELDSGEMEAEEALAAYRVVCRAKCAAIFLAEAASGEDEFLDFVLKGDVEGVG